MEINSALNAGLQGIQNSRQQLDQTAAEIAGVAVTDSRQPGDSQSSRPASDVNVAEKLIELREQELAFKASVEVVRSADQVLSEFVDDIV
ncbi:hypothetical protein QSV34_06180 [Porticoccus sp. W117]|uniref:hypothetical protein n=1 Tax=Porticoccus sp. W117 TaxID=3054777 RepID=UPI0025935FDB|nr:hypothetical protein [Porticoccus sp. W117]MDM3870940.1 hypothetical protein [Porticoccus sp. W117]